MSSIESIGSIEALPEHVDLLVVGGGPSGAAAAIAATRRGLRTLLVDRVAHPRDKVCGCCLAPRGQRVLREIGLAGLLEGARRIDGVRLACSDREVLVRRAGILSLSRATLDGGLLRAAAASGATLAWPFVATVEPDGLTRLRGPGGERVVRSHLRVVADGLHGASLHARPRFAWRVRPGGRIGLGAILPAGCVHVADEEIHMQIDGAGYAGLVRLEDGRVDLAAAVRPEAVRASGGAAACVARMLQAKVIDDAALHAATWHGTPQLWRTRQHLHDDDTLLAGDAGGYVEPFTGEGMGWALATGWAAGEHAVAVLRGEASCAEWERRARALVAVAKARCALVAWGLRHPRVVRTTLAAAASLPGIASRFAESIGAPRVDGGAACRA